MEVTVTSRSSSVCKMAAEALPDEESRPPPADMLRQEGVRPHPGPVVRKLHSILNEEYWDHHGWTALEEEALATTANIPEAVELSDEQGDDVEDDPGIRYD